MFNIKKDLWCEPEDLVCPSWRRAVYKYQIDVPYPINEWRAI
jgi:hypothetical protein